MTKRKGTDDGPYSRLESAQYRLRKIAVDLDPELRKDGRKAWYCVSTTIARFAVSVPAKVGDVTFGARFRPTFGATAYG